MTLKQITAAQAKQLVDGGALLVDVREAGEYSAESIPGARNEPLSSLGKIADTPATVIFHCKSGARTRMNAQTLAGCTDAEAYLLEGGIDAWKASGFPVS